jgi:hypothetical protein
MNKVQLRGHCQICGREQAAENGRRIAKHGYHVKNRGSYGWFQGGCPGQDHLAVELTRADLDMAVAQHRANAKSFRDHAEMYRTGKRVPSEINLGFRRFEGKKLVDVTVPWGEATAFEREQAINVLAHRDDAMARQADAYADMLLAVADKFHGQALRTVAKDAGPAPIPVGEQRKGARGLMTAKDVYAGRVTWKDERGFIGKTSTRAWRTLELVA